MSAPETAVLLGTLGGLLLAGVALDGLARRVGIPRVSLLLVFGVVVGPSGLDLLPDAWEAWYPAVSELALAMVGFLLGGEFTLQRLRERGPQVLRLSLAVTLATAAVVGAGLWLLGMDLGVALLLGTAATATDPAGVDDVLKELGAKGPRAELLRGVVAIDDLWGILLFGVTMAALGMLDGGPAGEALLDAGFELGGSLLLGLGLGLPMAYLTGRLRPGEPTRLEALGFVLLGGGLASWLGLSYLLTAVVMGAVVANLARHHKIPFRELEHLESPFLVLFFLMSGASAHLSVLPELFWLLLAYLGLRVLGRLVGGLLGAQREQPRSIGLALLPQAGVAVGMTLVATQHHPNLGGEALEIVLLGTVAFETLGPLLTRWSMRDA